MNKQITRLTLDVGLRDSYKVVFAKMGDTEEVAEDDGFLDALNGSATDDWADDDSLEVDTEDEEETSDI